MQANQLSGLLNVWADQVGAFRWSFKTTDARLEGTLDDRTQLAEFMRECKVFKYDVPPSGQMFSIELDDLDSAVVKKWADAS